MDHLQPDNIVHGERQRRKQSDPIACPVCGVTVRPADMQQHFAVEVERLSKLHISDATHRSARSAHAGGGQQHQHQPRASMPMSGKSAAAASSAVADKAGNCSASTSAAAAAATGGASGSGSEAAGAAATSPMDSKECWSTYQRIKNNRQGRLKIKSRKRKSSDPLCPVCNEHISDDINVHVELCLRRSDTGNNGRPKCAATSHARNGHHAPAAGHSTAHHSDDDGAGGGDGDDDDDDISIDVESAEPFEEYEWAGQTRIRASSLLQGGYGAAGVGTSIQNASGASGAAGGDEDEDLNVDGDDTHVFGAAQYGERDVILPSAMLGASCKEQTENLYLRKLVTGDCGRRPAAAAAASAAEAGNGTTAAAAAAAAADVAMGGVATPATPPSAGDSKDQIIEALKTRLRDCESAQRQQSAAGKCLICMDEFRQPVVSICCWHVHCEECWLRTLGARKLCPQCNMITSPTDLRRIYM